MQALQQMPPKGFSPTKSEIIVAYLQQMALPSLWQRVLSESDYELWDTVLAPYSIPAIKFAFDTWIGGAKRFPAPSDILPLCGSYAEQRQIAEHHKEQRTKGVLSPDVVFLLAPEIIARAQRYHAAGREQASPIEEEEIPGMLAQAKIRLGNSTHSGIARFPNGNPKYNRELTQARALGRARPTLSASARPRIRTGGGYGFTVSRN
jgi:hypothetical protein